MSMKEADFVSHVALADVLECRTLPRSVATKLEKAAGSDGQVSVDALVDMVVTDHESGGNRKVLRRSVLGITIAMVCLSAVVCGLVFGSVHLTTQMQVQDGVLYERSRPDIPMHAGATKAVYNATSLRTIEASKLNSLETLLFTDNGGTLHMYKAASVSVRSGGDFDVVTMSGEEFLVSADGITLVGDNATSGGRRLLQEDSGALEDIIMLGVSLLSTPGSSSGGVPAMPPAPPGPPGPTTPGTQTPTIDPNPQGGVLGCVAGTNLPCQTDKQCQCGDSESFFACKISSGETTGVCRSFCEVFGVGYGEDCDDCSGQDCLGKRMCCGDEGGARLICGSSGRCIKGPIHG